MSNKTYLERGTIGFETKAVKTLFLKLTTQEMMGADKKSLNLVVTGASDVLVAEEGTSLSLEALQLPEMNHRSIRWPYL
jgi:hypothetical protein